MTSYSITSFIPFLERFFQNDFPIRQVPGLTAHCYQNDLPQTSQKPSVAVHCLGTRAQACSCPPPALLFPTPCWGIHASQLLTDLPVFDPAALIIGLPYLSLHLSELCSCKGQAQLPP